MSFTTEVSIINTVAGEMPCIKSHHTSSVFPINHVKDPNLNEIKKVSVS